MNDEPKAPPPSDAKSERAERLNAALRANLHKRKQQGRRRGNDSDEGRATKTDDERAGTGEG